MRSLLDSWTKFGPAGRDSLDWSSLAPSALPSTDAAGQSSGEVIAATRSVTFVIIATVCFLLLFLGIVGFLVLRRRRSFGPGGKLGVANVIALEDLEDPERNCELLSSLRRSRGQHHRPLSSASEQDAADGVFLMVYLPPPYEHTLTRIARAASTRRSRGGAEEEGEEPRPRSKSRGGAEEEEGEEEEPSPRSKTRGGDQEEEAEPSPRSKTRGGDQGEEAEPSLRSKSRGGDQEEEGEEPSPRSKSRGGDQEEEEEEPSLKDIVSDD